MLKKILALFLTVLLLAGCSLPLEYTPATTAPTYEGDLAPLNVHFIDVGQADCILLECDGEYALIDAGNRADGDMVVEYLTDQGVDRLSLVVGSHPHEDHIGGMPDVLAAFPVDAVWFSHYPYTNSIVDNFLHWVKLRGVPLTQPKVKDVFRLGDATIRMLGPVKTDYEDVNDLSLVLRVDHGDRSFLFTGDMERLAETDLIESGANVDVDVLKVGHHGSYSSTSYRFLREVMPTYAVISVGRNNEYGHPHADSLSRLRDAEVTIYRTDEMHTIVATSDGTNITFTWENQGAQPWVPAAA